ncbi:MAG: DUF2877 domain-containing protein [Chloroflexi bacterium]|nr:MAG: DUF2877 domain-containing protein [Chloroflexota bacterium]
MTPAVTAQSIAAPLAEALAARPFRGRVLGVFRRACNLVDPQGRVVALVLPEVGNGPFAAVLSAGVGLFDTLSPGMAAYGNARQIRVGPLHIALDEAVRWTPRLPLPAHPLNISLILPLLEDYADWPRPDSEAAMARQMGEQAGEAAARLSRSLATRTPGDALAEAAARLAGLGNGLTPAGDDFLLGVMAALWLVGKGHLVPAIVAASAPRTTALSRAFLEAAGRGEFIEPWHRLVRAWQAENLPELAAAVEKVADFGASSGRDALAGFARTLQAGQER